jgi:hypothetical protein
MSGRAAQRHAMNIANLQAHAFELCVIVFVAYVGYALGKSDLRIRPALMAVTVVVAVILQGSWRLVLPHEGIDSVARAVALSPQSPTLVTVALVETAGIWIPVVIIAWATLRTRIWAAAYLIGAAAIGASAYYGPSFEARLEPHPAYELWLVLSLVFATIPLAMGCIAKRGQRTVASPGHSPRNG